MVRKQLYITDEQDAELKRRAHELGMTEAEFVRRALDAAFLQGLDQPGRARAARDLLTHARAVRRAVAPRAPRPWSREELYADRLARGESPG